MYDTAASEIARCLSKSSRIKTVTEPINNGKVRYYSIMNDGSSSTKTLDEKELFLLKTAPDGMFKPKLNDIVKVSKITVIIQGVVFELFC